MTDNQQDWSIHPGRILREALQAQGLTQAALAQMLHRPPQVISEIVGGKKAITADSALDLQQGLGISAEFWVHAQAEYDLWAARRRRTVPAKRTKSAAPEPTQKG